MNNLFKRISLLYGIVAIFLSLSSSVFADAPSVASGKELLEKGLAKAREFEKEWEYRQRRSSLVIIGGQMRMSGMEGPQGENPRLWSGLKGLGLSHRLKKGSELKLQIWNSEETVATTSPFSYVFGSADSETRWIKIIPCSLSLVHSIRGGSTWKGWFGGGVLRMRYKTRRSLRKGTDSRWAVFESRGSLWGYEISSGVSWCPPGPTSLDLEVKYLWGSGNIGYTAPSISGTYYEFINPGVQMQTAGKLSSERWRFSVDGLAVTIALRYYFR
ncbi:MAG: hypothetical protein QGH40_04245 [bacterium]|jgi:hypothetical protein|nr:hypothetical protein [bacterium]